MGFIILMISRISGPGKAPLPWGDDPDDEIFGNFVCYGYMFILLVQLVGTATGDKHPVQVSSDYHEDAFKQGCK